MSDRLWQLRAVAVLAGCGCTGLVEGQQLARPLDGSSLSTGPRDHPLVQAHLELAQG